MGGGLCHEDGRPEEGSDHLVLAEERRRVPVRLPAPRPLGLRMTHSHVGVAGLQTVSCVRSIRCAPGQRARSLSTGGALGFAPGRQPRTCLGIELTMHSAR